MSLKNDIAAAAAGAKHDPLPPSALRQQELIRIQISDIHLDSSQPRADVGDVADMIESIREFGLLQPVVLTRLKDKPGYLLLMGERRLTAARLAGLQSVPALVRTVEEHRRLEMQLVENLQRKSLHPVEEARAFQRLMDQHGHRQDDLARVLGRSRTSINQTLRILDLPEEILEKAAKTDGVTSSALLEIAKLDSPETQSKLLDKVASGEASIRTLRQAKAKEEAPVVIVPRRHKWRFEGPEATVWVALAGDSATQAQIISALEAALEAAKKEAGF